MEIEIFCVCTIEIEHENVSNTVYFINVALDVIVELIMIPISPMPTSIATYNPSFLTGSCNSFVFILPC